ncbi:unnamed protein product [Phytophthora fragariaefolia]|uniref:Unnamed protein product n=1 Tax=Phytophthora fragariaefolia TaxID=1490495 RepID=A0A9W7CMK1_9STRA|nr:unnamed protein product [Phytophthora fragariaefolia]
MTEVLSGGEGGKSERCQSHHLPALTPSSAALSPDIPTARRTSTTPSITRDQIRRPSIRKSVSQRKAKRLLRRYHDWKTEHMYLGRYSIDKMLAFEEYQQVASSRRVFAVIALTPLPGLLIMILLAAIPLQSPLQGITGNPGFFAQSWLAYTTMTVGMMFFIRASLMLPNSAYSHKQCLLISLLTTGFNELSMLVLGSLWMFPIPFRSLLGIPTYSIHLIFFHRVVIGRRWLYYRDEIVQYIPLFLAQASTLFIFQGVTITFANVPAHVQAIITIVFPVLRATVKRFIWRFSRCLEDVSLDITLCVVEIFGSLFQNACLQSARSPAIGGLMILVDFVQAIAEVKMYVAHKFAVDGRQTTKTAVRIIEDALFPGAVSSSKARGLAKLDPKQAVMGVSRKGTSVLLSPSDVFKPDKLNVNKSRRMSRIACLTNSSQKMLDLSTIEPNLDHERPREPSAPTSPLPMPAPQARRATTIDDVDISHRQHAKLLSQALQLVFASEVLVFAEYAEFACSVVYGLYTIALYQMPYAKYNLTFIGQSETSFWSAATNCGIYATFEGFTLVFIFTLVRAKYGLSTLYQLAFVLEKYWMSVQGTMIGSLALIFILNTVHQGEHLILRRFSYCLPTLYIRVFVAQAQICPSSLTG